MTRENNVSARRMERSAKGERSGRRADVEAERGRREPKPAPVFDDRGRGSKVDENAPNVHARFTKRGEEEARTREEEAVA